MYAPPLNFDDGATAAHGSGPPPSGAPGSGGSGGDPGEDALAAAVAGAAAGAAWGTGEGGWSGPGLAAIGLSESNAGVHPSEPLHAAADAAADGGGGSPRRPAPLTLSPTGSPRQQPPPVLTPTGSPRPRSGGSLGRTGSPRPALRDVAQAAEGGSDGTPSQSRLRERSCGLM